MSVGTWDYEEGLEQLISFQVPNTHRARTVEWVQGLDGAAPAISLQSDLARIRIVPPAYFFNFDDRLCRATPVSKVKIPIFQIDFMKCVLVGFTYWTTKYPWTEVVVQIIVLCWVYESFLPKWILIAKGLLLPERVELRRVGDVFKVQGTTNGINCLKLLH